MKTICKLEKVKKSFGEKKVLSDFSLEIKDGEFICIAGVSGSGKSTILNLIGMFEKPDSGKIELFGKSLPEMTSKEGKMYMRDRIFYMFQNFALIDDKSVDYNLNVPLLYSNKSKDEKKKMKEEALESVGLNKEFLGKKIFQLSGGEQQRVALSRALLREFDIILADEPTGSLDSVNRELVLDILKKFNKQGKTIIMVSHDEAIINSCSRVVRL